MADRDEMIRRQGVLARFGEAALRSDDAQHILTEACRLIADGLHADLAKVLEIDRPADEAVVRAGVGWKEGIVGKLRIPLGVRSSEAYAIEIAEPVITQDLRKEDRFEFAPFLREHGVVALVNVPIFLPGGEPYGLLQVDSREPRAFDEEDIAFLKTYAAVLGPIIDRLHKVADLAVERDRNAMLLRELQHRVKNDLAVVMSVIALRSRTAPPDVAAELKSLGQRIETLRLLHDQLYTDGAVERVPLRPYVERLLENLAGLHRDAAGVAEMKVDAADLEVSPSVAGSLGLIINEFTTNSFKYAFNGDGGLLTATFSSPAPGRGALRLSDNGVGFKQATSSRRKGSGMSIIEALAKQVGGRADWSSGDGVRLDVEFSLD